MTRQLRDTADTLLRHGIMLALGLASAPLMARLLGPEGLGTFSLVFVTSSIAKLVVAGGIPAAIIYFTGKNRLSRRSIGRPIWMMIGIAIGAAFLVPAVVFPLLKQTDAGSELDGAVFGYLVAAIIAGTSLNVGQGFLRLFRDFRMLTAVTLTSRALLLAGIFVLLLMGRQSVNAVLWNQIISTTFAVALVWSLVRRRWSCETGETETIAEPATCREVAAYGYKATAANLMSILNCRADTLMLAALCSPLQLGLYAVAVMIAEKVWMLSSSISEVSSTYIATGDERSEERIRQALATAKWTGIGTFLLCIAVAAATPLIPLVFGERFSGACLPMLLLLPGIWARGTSRVLAGGISAIGKPGLNAWLGFGALCLNIAINAALLPSYGAAGAAIATSVSYSCLLASRLAFLKLKRFSLVPLLTINSGEWATLASIASRRLRIMRP